MKYAIVENGIVSNIAVSNRPLAAGWQAIPTGVPVAIGDTFSGGMFYAPDGSARMSPEMAAANAKIAALEEQNAMLTECLLEISGVVYA